MTIVLGAAFVDAITQAMQDFFEAFGAQIEYSSEGRHRFGLAAILARAWHRRAGAGWVPFRRWTDSR